MQYARAWLEVVRISSCHWIFDHKWFSEADTSKEHIEHIIFFLYPLANPLTTDLFWCRLYQLGQLAEKQCPWVDRLEGEENFFCGQCVPNGCLLWKMTYGKISDHVKIFFMTSNLHMYNVSAYIYCFHTQYYNNFSDSTIWRPLFLISI